jgi:hypothetical protein
MVLTAAIADEVRALDARGLSSRKISAALCGVVGRRSVQKIVNGEWHPRETNGDRPGREVRRPCPPTRCDGCGGMMIETPCLTCQVRKPAAFKKELARRRERLAAVLAGRATSEGEDLGRRVMLVAARV